MERPGKKIRDDDDVSKNEVVLKEQRNEDGTRNQNGRLYKDRNPEQQERPVKGSGAKGTSPGRGTMRLIGTFLLAFLLVLLTTLGMGTATMETPDQTKVGTDRQWKRHQHVARATLSFDLGPRLVERSVALNNRSSWKRKLWERGAPAK